MTAARKIIVPIIRARRMPVTDDLRAPDAPGRTGFVLPRTREVRPSATAHVDRRTW